MNERRRRQARWQQGLLGVLALAGAAGVVLHSRHVADRDELRIVVGQLQSYAADLVLLDQEHRRLPKFFGRAHARRLAQKIQSAQRELGGMRFVDRELQSKRSEIASTTRSLDKIAESVGDVDAESGAAARECLGRLIVAEKALE
jgi:hypothetical protein